VIGNHGGFSSGIDDFGLPLPESEFRDILDF